MPTDIKTYAEVKEGKWPAQKSVAEKMESVSKTAKHPPGMVALLKRRKELQDKLAPLEAQIMELTGKIREMCRHRTSDLEYRDDNYSQDWEQ